MRNLDFLALVVSEIRGGPKFTLGVLCPPHAPNGKIFILKRVLGHIEMYVEFQLSSYSSFRDMRGPKFTLGGSCSLAEKFSYLKIVLGPI